MSWQYGDKPPIFCFYAQGNIFLDFYGLSPNCHMPVADLNWQGQYGPRESQLCILDGMERERLAAMHKIDPCLYEDIHQYLNNNCQYFQQYQVLASHPSANARLIFQQTTRRTHGNILGDMPFSSEIAGIIDDSPDSVPRSVYVRKIGEATERRISILDPAYECLQYPLLFPHADAGWSPEFKSVTNRKVTLLEYVRQLFLREPRMSDEGRLTQEYAVDMYLRVEENRLQFLRTPEGQAKLRMGFLSTFFLLLK